MNSSNNTMENIDRTTIHNRLIFSIVRKLLSEGYKVSADHIGYPNGKPEPYEGNIPDVIAKKDDEEIIVEAETNESLKEATTKAQWVVLSAKPNTTFWIIIPENSLADAKKLAKESNIKVDRFWTMKI